MAHKVVFNNCYGGFGLSMKAIEWLHNNCEDQELKRFIDENWSCDEFKLSYIVKDWFDDKRHHKDLVSVVEALGREANGDCAALAIAKINGNQYRIEEYDGAEEVVTPEESDWIVIE